MAVFVDLRKHKRFRTEFLVQWAIESQSRGGDGVLLDVSRAGARIQVDADFDGRSGGTITLNAPGVPALPHSGRIRWFRRLPGRTPTYVCGVVFLGLGVNLQAWDAWLTAQDDANQLQEAV